MRWSENVTLEFVKIYLNCECLWNPEHIGYKLKHHREKAYQEIALQFRESTGKSMTTAEVKIKIKNLRTTYVQQLQKILEKSSPDNIFEPTLVWFNEMDKRLKNIVTTRNANLKSSLDTLEVDSSVPSDPAMGWNDLELQTQGAQNPDPLVLQRDEDYDLAPEEATSMDDSIPVVTYIRSKKKKNKHTRTVQEYFVDSEIDCAREDAFDIYGKYIASQLRQMNLQKALRLQLEIQNLVSEARLSDFDS